MEHKGVVSDPRISLARIRAEDSLAVLPVPSSLILQHCLHSFQVQNADNRRSYYIEVNLITAIAPVTST